jgi:hypothetical protein
VELPKTQSDHTDFQLSRQLKIIGIFSNFMQILSKGSLVANLQKLYVNFMPDCFGSCHNEGRMERLTC